MNLENIYTPIEEAKKEVLKRWKDKVLQKKVEDFVGKDIPKVFYEQPFSILGRHVVSSNIETVRFAELAKESGLNLLGFEYLDDKFLTMNKAKLNLGKMSFVHKDTKTKRDTFDIFNLQDNNGKRFSEINTFWGERLVEFHHRILSKTVKNIKLIDMSNWIKKRGEKAADFYPHYLAMFIRNGILFDNYLLKGQESKFTEEIFLPSYKKVVDYFGIKPLIVKLLPEENEADIFWYFYEICNIIEK